MTARIEARITKEKFLDISTYYDVKIVMVDGDNTFTIANVCGKSVMYDFCRDAHNGDVVVWNDNHEKILQVKVQKLVVNGEVKNW